MGRTRLCGIVFLAFVIWTFVLWSPAAYAMTPQVCASLLGSAHPPLDSQHLPAGLVEIQGFQVPIVPGDSGTTVCDRYTNLTEKDSAQRAQIAALIRERNVTKARIGDLERQLDDGNWFRENYVLAWSISALFASFFAGIVLNPLIMWWLSFGQQFSRRRY